MKSPLLNLLPLKNPNLRKKPHLRILMRMTSNWHRPSLSQSQSPKLLRRSLQGPKRRPKRKRRSLETPTMMKRLTSSHPRRSLKLLSHPRLHPRRRKPCLVTQTMMTMTSCRLRRNQLPLQSLLQRRRQNARHCSTRMMTTDSQIKSL